MDAAGRPVLAQSVRDAMVAGVDAWGWLPTARGANELASYARQQHAALLVLPADLNDLHWLDRLKGESGPGEVQAKTDLPILTVELSAAETGG